MSPSRSTILYPVCMPAPHDSRRSRVATDVRGLLKADFTTTRFVFLLAAMITATPLRAGGDAAGAGSPGSAKVKASKKVPAVKITDSLQPWLQLPGQKAARAEIEASTLSPALKEKMLHGDALPLSEIEILSQAGLSENLILNYLRSSGGSYELLTKDIDLLRDAGLTDSVIDYLLTTRSRRTTSYYRSLYYSPLLLHDVHHFSDFHHSHTYFGDSHHQ
jgi:hypothetical protein